MSKKKYQFICYIMFFYILYHGIFFILNQSLIIVIPPFFVCEMLAIPSFFV